MIEKGPRVAEIWRWLIDEATVSDIHLLPDLKAGDHSTEFLHIVHAATEMAFKFKRIKVTLLYREKLGNQQKSVCGKFI
ncbi:MAG: hypothetical protein LBU18_07460 [Treponema sp.]|nr:hypothetical protein [Treponema sp.]